MNHGHDDAHRDEQATDDTLVSRVVDGDATAAELAAVGRDPVLRAQVAAVERARTALREVPPAPAGSADAAIAAAIAEAAASGAPGPPADLAWRRERRRRRVGAALAVAAALLVGVPLLAIALTSSDSSTDSASDRAATAAGSAATGPAATEGAPGAIAADAATADLGALTSEAQLRDEVARRLPDTQNSVRNGENADAPAAAASSAVACPTPAELAGDTLLFDATATWDAMPALVLVYAADPRTIVVQSVADCTVLALVTR